jgi:OOP family OmpA-OmpF porin
MKTALRAIVLACVCGFAGSAVAGDPNGVNDALQSIRDNWTDVQFSIDLTGLSDGAAVVNQPLKVEYEAAHPGYLTYLQVSSHGEIALAQPDTTRPGTDGAVPLPVHPPLGHERAVFLFSDRPLSELGAGAGAGGALGSDRAQADALVRKIQTLQAQGVLLAVRRFDYMVDALVGQTQYTTRSIIREVEQSHASSGTAPRFPTRIEFEFNSDQLTEQSKRDLDVFGAALVAKLRNHKVTLEGHTDAIGSDDYNVELSQRRAQAAQKYLMESFGLTRGQLEATGKGKSGAIASNDTEADRSLNRRVDFVFSSGGSARP